MKKFFIFLIILLLIICTICYTYLVYQAKYNNAKQINAAFQKYYNKKIQERQERAGLQSQASFPVRGEPADRQDGTPQIAWQDGAKGSTANENSRKLLKARQIWHLCCCIPRERAI